MKPGNQRTKECRQRKREQGLLKHEHWYEPKHHRSVLRFVESCVKVGRKEKLKSESENEI